MKKPERLTFDARETWSKRTKDFRLEIRPYVGYALQSVSLFVLLLVLAGSFFYGKLLTQAPLGFPFREIAALVLLPFAAWSPIRTYIREADTVFWLPLETEIARHYMTRAVNASFAVQAFGLLAAWLAVWPAFAFADGDKPGFIHALLVLLVLKRVLLQGHWTELKLTIRSKRALLAMLRWLLAGGCLYMLLTLSPPAGSLLVAATLLIYFGLIHLLDEKKLHWLQLVEAERRHRSLILRLLNQFVDVAELHGRPRPVHAPRKLIRGLAGLRFDASHTYRFLYVHVWLRSEGFGMTLRLTVLGGLIISFTKGVAAPAIVFLLFTTLTALQLKELAKAYRHSEWSFIYPLPPALRAQSAQTVIRRIHAVTVALLTVPLLWAMAAPYQALLLLALGLGLSYIWTTLPKNSIFSK